MNVQWDIPDPTPNKGEGRIEEFRAVRDLIRDKVLLLLKEQKVV
jgi:protein-tyrosine-phosphatase